MSILPTTAAYGRVEGETSRSGRSCGDLSRVLEHGFAHQVSPRNKSASTPPKLRDLREVSEPHSFAVKQIETSPHAPSRLRITSVLFFISLIWLIRSFADMGSLGRDLMATPLQGPLPDGEGGLALANMSQLATVGFPSVATWPESESKVLAILPNPIHVINLSETLGVNPTHPFYDPRHDPFDLQSILGGDIFSIKVHVKPLPIPGSSVVSVKRRCIRNCRPGRELLVP
ncbi:hypothetical protein JAAARDRAFT_463012 [Jaapia argillacea MUCL 33604]|uniref:Uncharacterized protein n=1 Tax=Jaapia argillacea MUCL 33604 TaxID=933084 RepID=A0A067Q653_9AGAM|nr:hypothetical protein JAAARDRAFT_463012 [Jaapia argillacea MUCL 33604]